MFLNAGFAGRQVRAGKGFLADAVARTVRQLKGNGRTAQVLVRAIRDAKVEVGVVDSHPRGLVVLDEFADDQLNEPIQCAAKFGVLPIQI